MEILMLAGALIAALGGMSALAVRVVRLPLGKRGRSGKRPVIAAGQATQVGAREPTNVLLIHVTNEYKRHTQALREALDLRRSRNEAEAFARLLNERILHVEAARTLGQFVAPTIGGRVRQWLDSARLDVLADTVRREVAEVRLPTGATRPLAGERALARFITWARGGPQTGAPHALATYHREQREHYRLAMSQARRLVREQRQDRARSFLATEQAHHLRANRDLKAQFQPGPDTDANTYGSTDPVLTAILN
jgi:hypothetical protein